MIRGQAHLCQYLAYYYEMYSHESPPVPSLLGLAKNSRIGKTAVKGLIYYMTNKKPFCDLKIGIFVNN